MHHTTHLMATIQVKPVKQLPLSFSSSSCSRREPFGINGKVLLLPFLLCNRVKALKGAQSTDPNQGKSSIGLIFLHPPPDSSTGLILSWSNTRLLR